MNAKVLLVLVLIVFGFGFLVGKSNGEVRYETEVVRVPDTRVETKTVTVREPLPRECERLVEVLTSATEQDEIITRELGGALGNIETAHLNLVAEDVEALVFAVRDLRDNKTRLGDASIVRSQLMMDAEQQATACNEAINN